MVSVGRESRHSFAGSLWLRSRRSLWFCHCLGCGLWNFAWGLICFLARSHGYSQNLVPHQVLDWEPQFFDDFWPKAFLSSLPHGPLHRAAHNCAAGFLKASEKENSFFWTLITEVTCCCHFALFYSLEADPWVQSVLGGRTKQGCEYQDLGFLGGQLTVGHHRWKEQCANKSFESGNSLGCSRNCQETSIAQRFQRRRQEYVIEIGERNKN